MRTFARPDRLKITLDYPNHPEARILDGGKGWRSDGKGNMAPADGFLLTSMVLQAARADLPWLLDERRATLKLLAPMDGGKLQGLEIPLGEGLTLTVYVDTATGRIVRSSGVLEAPGMKTNFATDYSDFRTVDGVLFPFREANFASNQSTGDTVITPRRRQPAAHRQRLPPVAGQPHRGQPPDRPRRQSFVIPARFGYHPGPIMETASNAARPALLVLEDGAAFAGTAFGAAGERHGEVVFNTSMSGYQEITTDPSYCGQIVVMTYPLIGNYGANAEDVESGRPWVEGLVVREISPVHSNWRAAESLDAFLARHGVPGISGVDTRALTRHLQEPRGHEGRHLLGRPRPGVAAAQGAGLPRPRRPRPGARGDLRAALQPRPTPARSATASPRSTAA